MLSPSLPPSALFLESSAPPHPSIWPRLSQGGQEFASLILLDAAIRKRQSLCLLSLPLCVQYLYAIRRLGWPVFLSLGECGQHVASRA